MWHDQCMHLFQKAVLLFCVFSLFLIVPFFVFNQKMLAIVVGVLLALPLFFMAIKLVLKPVEKQKKKLKELEWLNQKATLALRSAQIGIWDWDVTSNVLIWDDRLYEVYGVDASEFKGAYAAWEATVHPDDLYTANQEVQKALSKKTPFDTSFRIIWKDGSIRYIRAFAAVMQDPETGHEKMIGVNWDISRDVQREQQLRDTIQQLSNLNLELEQFSYMVSHDLQAPLRKILGYAEQLLKELPQKQDEQCKEGLLKIQSSAKHMGQLIQDLLQLSRLSRKDHERQSVDLNQVLQGVVSDLEMAITQSGAKVQLQQLPHVMANPTQMHQLFLNLIGNAIKYVEQGKTPVIQVESVVDRPDRISILVKDNGIGIAREQLDQIFQPFKRLVKDAHYTGTGIGLAICKKIVENHKGTITVESKPGEGSTFRVELPQGEMAFNHR